MLKSTLFSLSVPFRRSFISICRKSVVSQANMAPTTKPSFDYDLIVIGGGSGGLAASKEAVSYGKRVALIDYVKPTPKGTRWGIGGTCVNVGCIPKKLMHEAALQGEQVNELHYYGWGLKPDGKPLSTHGEDANLMLNWEKLVEGVQNNIKSSNFKYRVELRTKGVVYINAHASFMDKHTIQLEPDRGDKTQITGEKFIIATGERPRYPNDVEGALENSITSDDLFSLPYNPGKTLVVGASYVALECAGFLNGLGNDVSVLVRSVLLRGFDQQMAEMVGSFMAKQGVKFLRPGVPKKIEKIQDGAPGLYRVTSNIGGKDIVSEYNTVLFAIGRDPCTKGIGLEKVGVKVNPNTGKIPTVHEMTNVDNIFAVGDILEFRTELTPVAIDSAIMLVKRLYNNSMETFDYHSIPTTVFTPNEYGCVGLSEEDAIQKYGDGRLEVYHTHFKPFEKGVTERDVMDCYAKVICLRDDNDRILGIHYLGPNAGEVIQFAALSLRFKAKKEDLNHLVGIHPTSAEVFTNMRISKRSGLSPVPQGCCG